MDYPEKLIMRITGHRTRSTFDRYRHVYEDEVLSVGAVPGAVPPGDKTTEGGAK